MRNRFAVSGALTLAFLGLWGGLCEAADPPGKDQGKDSTFGNLVEAIKATPGCLGVETARTSSGKQVIFAWFENKKAALNWYRSETHQALMKRIFPDARYGRKPLADVVDENAPVMAVASITLTGEPTKEKPLPFKQIAIELYQPLGGGLSIGGRFAPEKMKVPSRKP